MTPIFGFLGSIGMPEMFIIGTIAVLLFGNRLPGLARSLGRSAVEFKNGLKGIEEELTEPVNEVKKNLREADRELKR